MTDSRPRKYRVGWTVSEDGSSAIELFDTITAGRFTTEDARQLAAAFSGAADRAEQRAQVYRWLRNAGVDDELITVALRRLDEVDDQAELRAALAGLLR